MSVHSDPRKNFGNNLASGFQPSNEPPVKNSPVRAREVEKENARQIKMIIFTG